MTARLVFVLVALALSTCTVPDLHHCFHQRPDPDAWCADMDASHPVCSPCASARHGCVATPPDPDDCPQYEGPDSASSDGGSSSTSAATTGSTSGTG